MDMGQVQLSYKIISIQARSSLAQAKCESVLPRGRAGIQVIFHALYLSRCLAPELHRTNGSYNLQTRFMWYNRLSLRQSPFGLALCVPLREVSIFI